MRVSGQVQIGMACRELLNSVPGATEQMFVADVRRDVERMMRDDNLGGAGDNVAKELPDALDLPVVDASARPGERSGRVYPCNGEFFILENRRQVVRNVFLVFRIRPEE